MWGFFITARSFEFLRDDIFDGLNFSGLIRISMPVCVPVIIESRNDVRVQMKDQLPRGSFIVDPDIDPVSSDRLFYFWSKDTYSVHDMLEYRLRYRVDILMMFLFII